MRTNKGLLSYEGPQKWMGVVIAGVSQLTQEWVCQEVSSVSCCTLALMLISPVFCRGVTQQMRMLCYWDPQNHEPSMPHL